MLDWPDDVMELADYLGIERFAVFGVSGGGPYALACAYKIPDRLLACGIAAGEWHRPHAFSPLAALLPWLLLPVVGYFFRDEEHARSSLLRFTKSWPEADRRCLAQTAFEIVAEERLGRKVESSTDRFLMKVGYSHQRSR